MQRMEEVLTCCKFGQCWCPGSLSDVVSSTNPLNSLCLITNPVRLLYKHIDNKLPAQICGRIECPENNPNIGISTMKAVSPVRSIRKPALYFSEHNLGISRSKSSSDDPLSLLYNMNDCYSRLKELVPSLPQNKSVSKMEILQHVIDYILDLQIALDQNPQQQVHGQSPPKMSVRSLGADISIISFQVKQVCIKHFPGGKYEKWFILA